MKERYRHYLLPGLSALVALLFVTLYLPPRLAHNAELRARIRQFDARRAEMVALLEEAGSLRRPPPDPRPSVPAWITANALRGLEDHLDYNNPYQNGQGAEVKLRSLTPGQVASFLGRLGRVNLILQKVTLDDRTGDGRWDLVIQVEVPR